MKKLCEIEEVAVIRANGWGLIMIDLKNGDEISTESELIFKDGIVYENLL